jgi:hypothetical protein
MTVRLAALALLSLSSVLALAQSPGQPPDAGRILQETREPFRLPPPSPDLAPRPPEPRPALGAQPNCASVAGFTLQQHAHPRGRVAEKVQGIRRGAQLDG